MRDAPEERFTVNSRYVGPADPGGPGRHSYSTMLCALKVDVKVQQELLRHADVRATLNIYIRAVPEALRSANSKVVRMALPEAKTGMKKRVGNTWAISVPAHSHALFRRCCNSCGF